MKVRWLGHACFLIVSAEGVRIITDPYEVGGGINYSPINETADIVVVSHDHADHNNVSAVKGKPEVVKGRGVKKVRGIDFKGVGVYHDETKGQQRGANVIFCFSVDGIKLCHLGDLGHDLTAEQAMDIGQVDVLLLPVGGFYTIDANTAGRVGDRLKPKVIIPMHFKTTKCDYPITGVEDFVKGRENVRRLDSSEVELVAKDLPLSTEIIVLKPAL